MFRGKLFEPTGFIIAVATLIFSLILFYNETEAFLGSLAAALMAAGLFWITYLILRFVWITFKT